MSSVFGRNRILQDIRELEANQSPMIQAHPMEDNMFDWHFTIRGPADTEFEGGIYHGRIILPSDYPLKPPSIIFLTPNGRFQTKMRVCLSISDFHPESWKPVWGVRTILEGIISFFPTPGEGAVGSIDDSVEERKRLAKLSVNFSCPICGKVKDLLLEEVPPVTPQQNGPESSETSNLSDSAMNNFQNDDITEDKSMTNSNIENVTDSVDNTTSSIPTRLIGHITTPVSSTPSLTPTPTPTPNDTPTNTPKPDIINDNYIPGVLRSTPDYYKDYPPVVSIENSDLTNNLKDSSLSIESGSNTNIIDEIKVVPESEIQNNNTNPPQSFYLSDSTEKNDGIKYRNIETHLSGNDINYSDNIIDDSSCPDNDDDILDGKVNNDPNTSNLTNNDDCEDSNDFKDISCGKLIEEILTCLIWLFILLISILITKKMKFL